MSRPGSRSYFPSNTGRIYFGLLLLGADPHRDSHGEFFLGGLVDVYRR